MNELLSIGPIDGRYASKVKELSEFFSESALVRYRIKMECEYLIALSELGELKLRKFTEDEKTFLRSLAAKEDAASKVKEIEATINHDVKAVEYYIKEELKSSALVDALEWVHFATTSEDTNNVAYAMMLSSSLQEVILPCLDELISAIESCAERYKSVAILARTHGQAASPTTLGKEFKVFAARLRSQFEQLSALEISAKLNGATGNYNAHLVAYPNVDWPAFTSSFISDLSKTFSIKLKANLFTTQIEPHDTYVELFDVMRRINVIMIDFNQDIWRYISDHWLKQKAKAEEVGSSTMPHKVNPIDFENSEGNLGLANALFGFFANKLPISRLQRDLSDSTVARNFGLAFAYSLLAYKSTLKGMSKLDINEEKISQALQEHVEVLAEAIQTVLRREGAEVPYEKLKQLTRGKTVTQADIQDFVAGLDVTDSVKAELANLEPANYIGLASSL